VPPITFAHRGARLDEPENTIAAFRRALDLGASGLETDAWLTADREVVLVHDGVVRKGLRRLRVGASTAADLSPLGIPRLADLYAEVGTDFELSVDLKDDLVGGPLIDVARAAGAADRLWCCAPAVDTLLALDRGTDVKLVHSERRRAIATPLERHAHDLANAGIDAMNMHHTDWSGGLVSLFHRFGVLAFAWDTQEARHIQAVLAMGMDALYCDRPDRLVAVVGEYTS
jgi:glycerophosphoryl diester phosphodiesterase